MRKASALTPKQIKHAFSVAELMTHSEAKHCALALRAIVQEWIDYRLKRKWGTVIDGEQYQGLNPMRSPASREK